MRNFTRLTIIIVFIIASFSARSQYYYYNNSYYDNDIIWEIGTSVGLMKGITDVGGKKGLPGFKSAQLNGSISVGVMYRSLAGARLEATWGRIAGADSNGANPTRNLSFRTPIREIALIGEFHPLMMRHHDQMPQFSPYVAGGLAWFSFNPQAKLNNNWINLQPLRTEGQGFAEKGSESRAYSLSKANVIMGMGVKYELSHLFSLRSELLFRYTFTDYLDDASTNYIDPAWFDTNLSPQKAALAKQLHDRSKVYDPAYSGPGAIRASPKSNDHYFTFNVKLSINLGRQSLDN